MAPNLVLLVLAPELTGLTTDTAAQSSSPRRFYDFIVKNRHTNREVAR